MLLWQFVVFPYLLILRDDTSEYADWSEWNNIESAEFYNRAFDYRAILTTDDSAFNIIVTKLQVNSEEPS